MIDESVSAFQSSHQPGLEELTPRQKALTLNRWLREKKRFGGLDGLNYRVLRNCMIGHIMRRDEPGCLPVVACAIFCSMADRIGLEAHCCPVPGHVHVVVLSQPGYRLDGRATDLEDADEKREKMYLDPYGSDDEVTVSNIEQHLANLSLESSLDRGLTPVSPASVALRTAQNIKASFQRTTSLPHEAWSFMVQLTRGHPIVNINAAYYSSMWASLLLAPAYSADWDLELSLPMKQFVVLWPEDAWMVETYLMPLWDAFMPSRGPWARRILPETTEFWKPLRLLREQDEMVPPVIRRDLNGADSGLYKIGQVFRHKRHNRIGIIRGWSHRGSSRFPSLHNTDDSEQSDENSGTEAPNPTRLGTRTYFVCFR
jgi:F-box protein 21